MMMMKIPSLLADVGGIPGGRGGRQEDNKEQEMKKAVCGDGGQEGEQL